MAKIDKIIFDACYDIASELTGCHPDRMSQNEDFDKIFDEVQEALMKIVTKQEQA